MRARQKSLPLTPPIPTMRSAGSSRKLRTWASRKTLSIIYIVGDNGTSAEGTLTGAFNTYAGYNGMTEVPLELNMAHYDDWGFPGTNPHMSVCWAWAFDAPFKWTKQVASHFGGTRQGMAISWPARITDKGVYAPSSTT